MKPGRELDKAVAEAMGYGNFWQDPQTGEWYAHHPNHTNLEDDRMPIPQYSAEGYPAWELWDWLEENNPFPWISMQRDNEGEPAVYHHNLNGGRREIASGDTYPHAICLAVLRIAESEGE